MLLLLHKPRQKCGMHFLEDPVAIFESSLEREKLLFKNTGDQTVDGLRAKKERRSTRSRLSVDSGFVGF